MCLGFLTKLKKEKCIKIDTPDKIIKLLVLMSQSRAAFHAYCVCTERLFSGGGGPGAVAPSVDTGSYFRGRPRLKWRRFTNSLSSTIQNEPKSSSYLTKHLCNERFVRIAFWKMWVRREIFKFDFMFSSAKARG